MRLLTKEFYTLAELQAAWEMADHDVQYLIATGRLKLSIQPGPTVRPAGDMHDHQTS